MRTHAEQKSPSKCLARKIEQILSTNNRDCVWFRIFVCIETIGMSAISMAGGESYRQNWLNVNNCVESGSLRTDGVGCRIQFGSERTKRSNEWLIRSATSWLILDRTYVRIKSQTRSLNSASIVLWLWPDFVTPLHFVPILIRNAWFWLVERFITKRINGREI